MNASSPRPAPPLGLLSIVIPARDEEGCVASTVHHLHLELKLRGVPHEIIVVDDGSSDRTWEILQQEAVQIPELRPVQNLGLPGFILSMTLVLFIAIGGVWYFRKTERAFADVI